MASYQRRMTPELSTIYPAPLAIRVARRSMAGGIAAVALLTVAIGAVAPAAAQTMASGAASSAARQTASDALKKRPWYPSFRAVVEETNALGRARIDAAFGDIWLETDALVEAEKRIDNGTRENRPPTIGAINDAIDLNASSMMWKAGCFAALAQRQEFKPQTAALTPLRVDGATPEPFRSAVRDYAGIPCESPQNLAARDFDPRRAYEGGKKLLNAAVAAGTMRPLARFFDERGLLKPQPVDNGDAQARVSVEADFRRFDSLYDGHADLLRNYRSLFADYCPTDQRFCAMREMLDSWGRVDRYCDDVTRYVSTYYGDITRRDYLSGVENAGLNRAWEAYHLKFAPACLALTKRRDLAPLASRRLDIVATMFAEDPKVLGENGVARLRDALRGFDADTQNAARGEERIKAYRIASGLDQQVASINPGNASVMVDSSTMPAAPPSDDELKIAGSEATERELRLDRAQILDIQERLAAIGGMVSVGGGMSQNTRAAIRSWQGAVGLEPTGFFTRAQFDLLKLRTQDRWLQWRANREAVAEPPAQARGPVRERRRQVRRGSRVVDEGVVYRRAPRRSDGFQSDIPGAIPAYSWR